MLDIKFIRDQPDLVKDNMKKKFREDLDIVDTVMQNDEEYRKLLQEAEQLRHQRNQVTQEINNAKKTGGDITELLAKAKEIPQKIKETEERQSKLRDNIISILNKIPNIMHESVPLGKGEEENVERERHGEPIKKGFPVKSHVELCEQLGIADFDSSARVAGNGFFYLIGELALLNQALIRFGIDFIMKRGFMFMEPPLMVRKKVCDGMVDFSFFEEIIYKVEGEDLYLIPTSEFPLITVYMDQVINEQDLPIKLCGYSQCFRKEIGAHGIDEKGLFRTHQFNKVEQVVICRPEDSYKFYDEMLQHSKDLFTELGLPTRVFESCSGDLGDLKSKGADLEAWSPRKDGYFEICSVSNLTDNQSRRLNIKVDNGKERYLPHTLNNTVIATSRAMVAILENFQNEDGSITIPDVLGPYMNNMKKIESKKD